MPLQIFKIPESISLYLVLSQFRSLNLWLSQELLIFGKDKKFNIYRDSRYILGIAHDFHMSWKAREFKTTAGTPMENEKQLSDFLGALLLPKEITILKIEAHIGYKTPETKVNLLLIDILNCHKAVTPSPQSDKILNLL